MTTGESAGLFFHVMRNAAILIDSFAAVYFDATYGNAGGRAGLFVLDLRPKKFSLWGWNKMTGQTANLAKTFSNEQEFYETCESYRLLKPKSEQQSYDNILGCLGERNREDRVYDFERVKRILEGQG